MRLADRNVDWDSINRKNSWKCCFHFYHSEQKARKTVNRWMRKYNIRSGQLKLSHPPPSWPTPPLFSELRFWRGGGSDRVGRLRTPKSAVSRAKTVRYPKSITKMVLLGGRAGRRPKILGFLGPLKCDSLRGETLKTGPKKVPKIVLIKTPKFRFWAETIKTPLDNSENLGRSGA